MIHCTSVVPAPFPKAPFTSAFCLLPSAFLLPAVQFLFYVLSLRHVAILAGETGTHSLLVGPIRHGRKDGLDRGAKLSSKEQFALHES
jgi:hypothetical protein